MAGTNRTDKNKSQKITANNIIKSKIDIKAGSMTFGQRIELGKIFSNADDELLNFENTFVCLHGYKPKLIEFPKLTDYFTEIVEGIAHWVNAETIMLKYEPTPEQKQAGIKALSKSIGEMGTVDALAEKYGIDPDVVLGWEYAKVFGILFADLEKAKYQKRYNKIIDKKK